MRYFIFVTCILLFMSVTFASDINQTDTTTNNINEINTDNIEYVNQYEEINDENIIYTEDILDEEIDYDLFNNLEKISRNSNTNNNYESDSYSNSIIMQNSNIKDIYVNPNANLNNQDGSINHPYGNISYAVSQASTGYINIIHLSAGNHLLPTAVTISKTIIIIGDSKTTTNITCNLNQAFRVSNYNNLTIEKVRLQNAYHNQGGAITTGTNTTLIINDCTFNNNSANNGAVLFASGTGTKSNITNSLFENNTANKYGVLQVGGQNSVYNIQNCIFKENALNTDDFSGSGGAAIYTSNYAIANVNYCVFTNNIANWGNAILLGNHGTLNVTYSNFTFNIANSNTGSTNKTKGGAIAVGSGYAEIGNCYFYNNKADIGGAISINSGEPVLIYSCIFQQNLAYTQGGAINNYGTLTVKDSIFIKNNGTRRGGAILDIGNNEILVDNCNFVDNRVLTSSISGSSMVPQEGSISISGECHTFTIINSIFNHSSAYYGGAIYSEVSTRLINIENTVFHNNTAHYGASIVIAGETILITNNDSFNYNRALKKGGAIIINGSALSSFNNTKFFNNSVSVSGDGDGGAIYVSCYASLDFNNCNFESNYANINGGAICSMSVVTITMSRSNITYNRATRGSGIYINNTGNYQTYISKIAIDTTTFVNNSGLHVLYSVKPYESTWNYNIVSSSWWGSNVFYNTYIYNFYNKNYYLLTITVNGNRNDSISWTNNDIIITLNRADITNKNIALSFTTVKEGSILKYPDNFLPPRVFTLKEDNNSGTQEVLNVNYILNNNSNIIEIKLDNQKITIYIV